MDRFGVKLIGFSPATLRNVLVTLAVVGALTVVRLTIVAMMRAATGKRNTRAVFWTRQGTSLATLVATIVAVLSIWFDDKARLTSALGFAAAGLAIAAQRVVTAFAGYLVII